jgi:hypothetical protein
MPITCDNPGELAEDSACFNCFSAQQLLAIQTYLLCQLNGMDCDDPQPLMDEAKCFMCFSQTQLLAISVRLLCLILAGGGGGAGTGCVECGDVNPTIAPSSGCCLYYRRDNGAVWFWNSAAWIPLITA